MKKSEVRNDLKKSTRSLLRIISNFPVAHFHSQPEEGGRSVSQIADHLIKTETSILRLLTGSTNPSDRRAERKVAEIKSRLLDFDSKMKAFGPIVPDDKPKDKAVVVEALQDIRQRLTSLIEVEDLTRLVTGFKHPIFGAMTRLEWIYFAIFHSKRHAHQIEQITGKISVD